MESSPCVYYWNGEAINQNAGSMSVWNRISENITIVNNNSTFLITARHCELHIAVVH